MRKDTESEKKNKQSEKKQRKFGKTKNVRRKRQMESSRTLTLPLSNIKTMPTIEVGLSRNKINIRTRLKPAVNFERRVITYTLHNKCGWSLKCRVRELHMHIVISN